MGDFLFNGGRRSRLMKADHALDRLRDRLVLDTLLLLTVGIVVGTVFLRLLSLVEDLGKCLLLNHGLLLYVLYFGLDAAGSLRLELRVTRFFTFEGCLHAIIGEVLVRVQLGVLFTCSHLFVLFLSGLDLLHDLL